ncbi:SDR family NAD(P)-dependent oxidoreductase [Streptomyces sp. AV19]|nr:SDR family NAD(P)-dependent oxidoreductase [Streptomyces sp. AV19]MDG4533629.1 SDR family NAD(P)-dependent oxidoreductase [Streptomyces sp. AV19]
MAPTGHPFLSATAPLATDEDGLLLTGRISLRSHPWLADHVNAGTLLFPGTAFLELALQAASHAHTPHIEELVLRSSLVLHPAEATVLQVTVKKAEEAGGNGRRELTISSHPDSPGTKPVWSHHATGILSPGTTASSATETHDSAARLRDASEVVGTEQWPPPGAEPVGLDGVYDQLAASDYVYGPAFQGLRAVWRHGADVLAEVHLPRPAHNLQAAGATRFALHPTLLDSALQPVLLGLMPSLPDAPLPFTWSGVRQYTTCPDVLRVRLRHCGNSRIAIDIEDESGQPVAAIASLLFRPAPIEPLQVLRPDTEEKPMFAVEWTPLDGEHRSKTVVQPAKTVLSDGEVCWVALDHKNLPALLQSISMEGKAPRLVIAHHDANGLHPADLHSRLRQGLELLQGWLAAHCFAETRLALVTHNSVATSPDESVDDLAGAALWGLFRSAQSENPGRIFLLDADLGNLDEGDGSSADDGSRDIREEVVRILAHMMASGEPQAALRDHHVSVPRLMQVAPRPSPSCGSAGSPDSGPGLHPSPDTGPCPNPESTTLITGGTGALGATVARHLVARHGARRLLLLSRRGPAAPGADRLRQQLSEQGAHVEIIACDTADRAQLAEALKTVPSEHPITCVVHAAGILDDSVIETLSPEQMSRVVRAKADTALHLHGMTHDLPVAAFVMFSSVAGTVGTPGQGNYAAANALLDGLAQHRRARGLPALSLAWGFWDHAEGMAGHLREVDIRRLTDKGHALLMTDEALSLFDTALSLDQPVLVPARFDITTLRAERGADGIPAVLKAWARAPRRRPVSSAMAGAHSSGDGGTPSGGDTPPEGVSGHTAYQEHAADGRPARRHLAPATIVRKKVAEILGYAGPESVEMERSFRELGFDSLAAIELRNRLSTATGHRPPVTLLFDHPTPSAVARYLEQHLEPVSKPGRSRLVTVLGELEALLAALPPEDLASTDTAQRMTRIMRLLPTTGPPHRQPTTPSEGPPALMGGDTTVARIDSATPDEIFAFIDQELGRAPRNDHRPPDSLKKATPHGE